ncbi:MAG: assimilatory sulfite reductase (NADPH) hemoprotein subunit [Betaproteobacteria bacterium]
MFKDPHDRSRDVSQPLAALNPAETVKRQSHFLRGGIAEGLRDPITGAIPEEATQILKFHGIYEQDDRDLRAERRRQKLEPAYQFMVRLRLPGGVCTPAQWLQLDEIARRYCDHSLRLTTRQTFQLHGVLKKDLKRTIQAIDAALLDTIAACGDDNRGVLCSSNPGPAAIHAELYRNAKQVSAHLLPRTHAYREIWLDEAPLAGAVDEEPIYGPTYLPRKFKIAFVVPPMNDVDIFAQDLGYIAIVEEGRLAGFNVAVGGGLGRTDRDPATYPRLADVIGFCRPEEVLAIAEQVVKLQRDYGDRVERKHARMKYTIDDRGLDWFKAELERRLGFALEPARPFRFETNCDRFGWTTGSDGWSHYTLFVENGRVRDGAERHLLTGLAEIAKIHSGEFRLTANQNLIIARIAEADRESIAALLAEYGLDGNFSLLRRNAMACVALPTCGLAMAESERYLPTLMTKLEALMAECGLADESIIVRMSGCPNGCSRPYLAEIGFSGRGPGTYNLYLGGGFHGQRLNRLVLENANEEKLLATLTPIIRRYADERQPGERFGDFVIRAGIVREVIEGRDFNSVAPESASPRPVLGN